MIRIAIEAGLPHNLELIHEPEAAAILCFLEDMENGVRASSSSYLRDETTDVRSFSKVKQPIRDLYWWQVTPSMLIEVDSSPAIGIHHGS